MYVKVYILYILSVYLKSAFTVKALMSSVVEELRTVRRLDGVEQNRGLNQFYFNLANPDNQTLFIPLKRPTYKQM